MAITAVIMVSVPNAFAHEGMEGMEGMDTVERSYDCALRPNQEQSLDNKADKVDCRKTMVLDRIALSDTRHAINNPHLDDLEKDGGEIAKRIYNLQEKQKDRADQVLTLLNWSDKLIDEQLVLQTNGERKDSDVDQYNKRAEMLGNHISILVEKQQKGCDMLHTLWYNWHEENSLLTSYAEA